MKVVLQRITTEYVDSEDRIRLSGDPAQAPPVVLWLTLRLFKRVLPPLLQWVEKQSVDTFRPEVRHGFAQQAARAELPRQEPVRARHDSVAWLVHSVDITQSAQSVRLNFKGADGQDAALTLAATPMRQWLNIVHDVWQKSGWPMDIWPVWIIEASKPLSESTTLLH